MIFIHGSTITSKSFFKFFALPICLAQKVPGMALVGGSKQLKLKTL